MPRADGPHTSNSMPGREYRGSKRRVDQISPFEDIPRLLLALAAVLLTLGLCGVLIYQALIQDAAHPRHP